MKAFPIQPLADLIFVRRVDDYTGPLLRLPCRQQKSLTGCVIAVGPGRPLPDGSAVPMELKAGDRVWFGICSGMEANFDGIDLLCMREEDVLVVKS
jgi:chaperonin GroES